MRSRHFLHSHSGNFQTFWNARTPGLSLAWLGQAGFAMRFDDVMVFIDPYLSDSLARKYAGTEKPHSRMMPPPVAPGELGPVNFTLCTHRHGDHMDPETLADIASRSPHCRFVLPRAEEKTFPRIPSPNERLILADAGETFRLAEHLSVTAIPAAHETLALNERGEHHFLGYILEFGELAIYHSGDTIPFPGLAESLAPRPIDLALLPVNGRGKGVPGNLDFEEAVALCRTLKIPFLIPHHFGMFAFNTVDPTLLIEKAGALSEPSCVVPNMQEWWTLE
jgi:L-ascorbate metabolism protein UlaG (beta-lactamase superfamily)